MSLSFEDQTAYLCTGCNSYSFRQTEARGGAAILELVGGDTLFTNYDPANQELARTTQRT
jgi:hypothetical protein